MRNNSNNMKNSIGSNAPFILIIALFIIVFVVVSYFLVSGSAFGDYYIDNLDESDSNETESTQASSPNTGTGPNQVFNIRDNIFTYNEAKAVCAAHNAHLATLQEMIDAYKGGANWCSYGWSDGQLALYPTQKEFWAQLQMNDRNAKQCGEPGLNGGYFQNADFKFGANCFGERPEPKGSELEKDMIGKNMSNPYENMIDDYKNGMNNFRISPWSEDNWSSCQ